MGLLFSESFDTLDELFINQLKDLYDAEHRIVDALPKMADKASNPELVTSIQKHLAETREQISRLEKAFKLLDISPEREKYEAITGLIKEGDEILDAKGSPDVIDAGIIAACQRVEHYEMAGYGTAATFARKLGHASVAELLEETLSEEKHADEVLTNVAETAVNPRALAA